MVNRIPPVFLWVAIAVSLFLNVVNINLIGMVADNQRSNTVLLCQRVHPTQDALNLSNGTFHDVIKASRDNALKRINTPKELPSDKKTVQQNTKYLPLFRTTPSISCKGFK